MTSAALQTRRIGLKTWLPALLFILAAVFTVFTTWNATLYCLDGDASSEMVLAHHLNETGKILSTDWNYSSELRVLNTQLVFAPLFSVFSDWHMVRFTGALILQAMLVSAFFYLGKQAKLSAGSLLAGGTLLLLPVSTAYGRFVLYHSYYMPHIILGFLIGALFMSCMRHARAKHPVHTLIRFLLLCALSLGSGLGGIRQGVVTHVPLMLLVMTLAFQDAKDKSLLQVIKTHWPDAVVAGCALFAFLLGYLVNIRILDSRYVFASYQELKIDLLNVEKLPDILFGIFHSFGFRDNLRIISLLGILSAGAVFSFLCSIVRGVLLTVNPETDSVPPRRFLGLFAVSSLFVMLCVFLFLDYDWYYPLYLLPVTAWFVPLIAAHYDAVPVRISKIRRGDVCLLLSLLLLFCNGFANSAFFASGGRLFTQRYEGMSYEDMTLVKRLEKPVAFLMENGYELGYSQFWSANPVTEMSDGAIKMINLVVNRYDRPLVVHDFLMLRSTYYMETDKTFLLLPAFYNNAYVEMDIYDPSQLVYNDGEFFIYHFDDPSVLWNYTSW